MESGTQWRDGKRTKPDDTKSTEECVPNSTISENLSPEGLIWSNNSCGYDSVFMILYQIWLKDPHIWSGIYKAMNTEWMGKLADRFKQYKSGQSTLEISHNEIRRSLAHQHPARLRWGGYIDIEHLLSTLLSCNGAVSDYEFSCEEGHLV